VGMFQVIMCPMVKYQGMHFHQLIIRMEGQGLLSMNGVTMEGNNLSHIPEKVIMILEEGFHLHLYTMKIVTIHIRHILLLHHQVRNGFGGPLQHTLGAIEGDTSLHHMEGNSGSSSLMEVGPIQPDLTHINHRTVTTT
jgi:hypothetical protein